MCLNYYYYKNNMVYYIHVIYFIMNSNWATLVLACVTRPTSANECPFDGSMVSVDLCDTGYSDVIKLLLCCTMTREHIGPRTFWLTQDVLYIEYLVLDWQYTRSRKVHQGSCKDLMCYMPIIRNPSTIQTKGVVKWNERSHNWWVEIQEQLVF